MAQRTMAQRIRQRRRRRLIVLGAVLVLLVGGGLAYLIVTPGDETGIVTKQPPGTVRVPTVDRTIPAGETIHAGLVSFRNLEPRNVPGDALLLGNQIVGRVALRDVHPGVYLREEDLAPVGAPTGLSGLARPGRRIVVVPEGQLNASADHLNPGDRVDVLALSIAGGIAPGTAGGRLDTLRRSAVTVEGGGSQPGDPNALARRLARGGGTPLGTPLPVSAVLISEDAEILVVPEPLPRTPNSRVRRNNKLVLQMLPEEAHATTLALASGQQLRFVYRPFNDRSRVTAEAPVQEFTYPIRDVRQINVFRGVTRTQEYTVLE